MKYILSFVGVVVVCCTIFLCGGNKGNLDNDYLRIHITANSNSIDDQNVKYKVKDAVVEFLIPELSEAQTKEEARIIVTSNLEKLTEIVKLILRNEGKKYSAHISVTQEDMPTRAYGNLVLEEGVYDCLKIDLGEAKGDNWWCVVFPAVCFVSSKNPENYEYISKIWEIINSVT